MNRAVGTCYTLICFVFRFLEAYLTFADSSSAYVKDFPGNKQDADFVQCFVLGLILPQQHVLIPHIYIVYKNWKLFIVKTCWLSIGA